MIIDGLTQQLFNQKFDRDGALARQGRVVTSLLEKWLEHPYFFQNPPKSTGREEFGKVFITKMQADAGAECSGVDLIATATDLVARSIFEAYQRFVLPDIDFDELIVSGGGALNPVLMQALAKYFQLAKTKTSTEFGIPVDAKEAICFAILANETISGNFN